VTPLTLGDIVELLIAWLFTEAMVAEWSAIRVFFVEKSRYVIKVLLLRDYPIGGAAFVM